MMKNYILPFIFIGLITSVTTQAQSTADKEPQLQVSSAFLSFGRSITEANLQGQQTRTSNLPGIDQNQFNVGFGGGVFFKRFYFGGEGSVHFKGENYNADYRSEVTSGYGLLNIGYIVKNENHYLIYPGVGIGGGGVEYAYRVAETGIMANPQIEPGTSLKAGFLLIALQINTDFYLKPNTRKGGLVLGVTVGYNWSPVASEWSDNGDQKFENINSFNAFNANGLNFKVKLGWGAKK